jgi:hypothetical protein
MVVHAVAALAPLAAVAYVFEATGARPLALHPGAWGFIVRSALVLMLSISVASTVTGVFERNRVYATWHRTHRIKLVLSGVLIAVTAVELGYLLGPDAAFELVSPFGIAVVLVNNLVTFALCAYGLKLTLGRQGIGMTSYVPDMFKDEPVDILDATAERVAAPPKLIDLLEELNP